MSDFDINFNSLKNINIEQLLKIIQLQSDQIESQKSQINALIKCQQTLLEGMYQHRSNDNRDQNKSFAWPNISQKFAPVNCSPLNNIAIRSECNAFDTAASSRTPVSRKSQPPPPEYPITNVRQIFHQENNDCELNDISSQIKKEVANKFQEESINFNGLHSNEIELNDDEEDLNLSSLQEFASKFKARRIELGFTQRDVGVCLGLMQGNDFSQTTLSRFEALNLSYRNMRKLQPFLQRWLDAIDRDGRDTVMARVSAFYQQQRSMIEEESENTDTSFASGQCRKRLAQDPLDVLEVVHDDYHHRVTADSTTTHIKSSQSPTLLGSVPVNISHCTLFRGDQQTPGSLPNQYPLLATSCFPSPIVTANISSLPHQRSEQLSNLTAVKKRRKKAKLPEEMLLRLEGIMAAHKARDSLN